jgi:hypothetical protein
MKTLWRRPAWSIRTSLIVGAVLSIAGVYIVHLTLAATYTVPASIAADCSVDVTTPLNDWIKSVPNNSVLNFGTNACYRIEGTLIMEDRHNLTFSGNNAEFKATTIGTGDTKNRTQWRFLGGSNLTVNNMTVRGVNTADYKTAWDVGGHTYEHQHGFFFGSTQGATLDNVKVYNVWGDSVLLAYDLRYGVTSPPNRNIVVKNSHFEGTGRHGFGVTHVEGLLAQNNYIGNIGYHVFDAEPDIPEENGQVSDTVRDIRILDNTIGPLRFSLISVFGPNTFKNVSNITVSGNTMNSFGITCYPPVYVEGNWPPSYEGRPSDAFPDGITVENNRFKTNSGGVQVRHGNNVVFRNNKVEFSPGGCAPAGTSPNGQNWYGIDAVDARVLTVTGNDLTGGVAAAYIDSTSTGLTACDNKLTAGGGMDQPVVCSTLPPRDTVAPTVTLNAPGQATGTVAVSAAASDNLGASAITKVEFIVDGASFTGGNLKAADTTAPYGFDWDTTPLPNGEHKLQAVVYDSAGNSARSAVVIVTVTNNLLPLRINAGGPAYTDGSGTTWKTDQYYVLGLDGVNRTESTTQLIAGTTNPVMYQTGRWCSRGYALPIGNGSFTLRLHFAEIIDTAAGNRIFNVLAEGQTLLSNFDIYKEVGSYRALIKEFPVTVGDGTLNIAFTDVKDCSKISAIEVLSNNQAPAVSITSPANNASFTAPASITVSANASDADGSISKVEFFQGATKLGEDTSSPYSFAWNSVPAGSYSLTAKATDNTGAVTTSPVISISVVATTKTGDLNGDGSVNIFDLSILLSNYNTADPKADINQDGTVNIFDLSILLSNYGK